MKSKLLKIVGFGGLAVFMALATLLGCIAITPAVLASSSQSQSKTLGLNPETDPVVFTTTAGLEIRKSNAQITSTTTYTTNADYTYTQDLTSFYYFTMGTYSGTIYTASSPASYTLSKQPVNWIIIGRGNNTKMLELKEEISPAAQAVKNDTNAELRKFFGGTPESVTLNDEIPDDCVLVLSEKLLGNYYFNSTGNLTSNKDTGYTYGTYFNGDTYYGNRYRYFGANDRSSTSGQSWTISGNAGGSLYNYINNLFNKNNSTGAILGNNELNFTQAQADLIRPQQLYTYYSNGSSYNYVETPSTDGGTFYTMFPLASSGAHSSTKQNFCVENYLTTASSRVTGLIGSSQGMHWWIRSGGSSGQLYGVHVYPNGELTYAQWVRNIVGVRPAFVMEFTPNLLN